MGTVARIQRPHHTRVSPTVSIFKRLGICSGASSSPTCRHCCVSLLLEADRASVIFVCPQGDGVVIKAWGLVSTSSPVVGKLGRRSLTIRC